MEENLPKRKRGRPARGATVEGKQAIKDAALIAFGQNGFTGTSIAQIAEAAGVAKPLVHYHFASKDELWRAAVAEGFDSLRNETLKLVMAAQQTKPEDPLAAFIQAIVRANAHRPHVHLISLDEMRLNTDRAEWMKTTYILPMVKMLIGALPALGLPLVQDDDMRYASHLIPAFNGAMNFPFIDPLIPREAFNVDVFTDEYIEAHAAFITTLLRACVAES